VARTIPHDHRSPLGKAEIALELIDHLSAGGWPISEVAAEDGYAGNATFQSALATRQSSRASARGTDQDQPSQASVALARRRFDWLKEHLGLDHFEGRTWVGWHHHVSLVFAAYGFLATLRLANHLPPFPEPPGEDWSI
jgi:SRSO17 transposase